MDEAAALEAGRVYEAQRAVYQEFGDAVRSLVAQLCRDEKISTDTITCRIKETASLVQKLQRQDRYSSLEDLTDKVGIRIVTRYLNDVDRVSEILCSEFKLLEDVRHGGESVEVFGYSSRHLILKISDTRSHLREWRQFADVVMEIQVRSILQHAWASISHGLDYKSSTDVPKEARRQLFRVAALLETGDELFDTFRGQVDSVKSSYRGDVERDNWRGLPVDSDSIRAAINNFPLIELQSAAEAQGWSRAAAEIDADIFLSRLTVVSAACGINTLGEIAEIADRAVRDRDWLRRLRSNLDQIYANPLDIITLRTLSENPNPVAAEAVKDTPMREEVVERALTEHPSIT